LKSLTCYFDDKTKFKASDNYVGDCTKEFHKRELRFPLRRGIKGEDNFPEISKPLKNPNKNFRRIVL
jgi:hypothetical protein